MKRIMLWIVAVLACCFLPGYGQAVLDCSNAIEIFHGQTVQGTTVGAPSRATKYHGCTWNETGNEVIYKIINTSLTRIIAALTDINSDLDIFILNACDTSKCVAYGDRKAIYPNGVTGTYYVIVDGKNGAKGSFSLTIQLETGFNPKANILWSEDFESNPEKDFHSDYGWWEFGEPLSGPFKAFVGKSVAATGLSNNYPDWMTTRLIRHTPFTVPEASRKPCLELWHWINFGGGDAGIIQIKKADETVWKDLYSSFTWTGDNVWTHFKIDLSAYAGQLVNIAFLLKSTDDGSPKTLEGWFIDNVAVTMDASVDNGYFDSFDESSSYFWIATNSIWETGIPTTGPLKAYSHPYCLATCLDGKYTEWVTTSVLSPEIKIPKSGSSVSARWHQWYSFAQGDYGTVEVKAIKSKSWLKLDQYSGSSAGWHYPFFDITQLADSTIQFKFTLKAIDNGGWQEGLGWYIDDFEIRGIGTNLTISSFAANPTAGTVPLLVVFQCQATNSSGAITEYRWDLDGNGTIDTTTTMGTLTYTFKKSGVFGATCTVIDNSGATATSAKLNITVQNPDRKNISFADTTISAGEIFAWPLYIDNATQLAGVSAKIKYDPAILKALQVSTTPLTSGFTPADTIRNGTIAFGMARATGMTGGSGALVKIEFQVLPTAKVGDTCSVVIESCEMYDDQLNSIPVSTRSGKLTVAAPITGDDPVSLAVSPAADTLAPGQTLQIIASGKNSSGVSVAVNPSWRVVNLFGAIGSVAPASGNITTFTATGSGDGLVIASQASLADTCILISCQLLGDLNIDQKITVVDAIMALQIAAGKRIPSRYEAYASDLNNNKSTDEGDAYLILVTSLDGILRKTGAATLAEIRWQPLQQLENGLWRYAIRSEPYAPIHGAGLALKFDVSAMTPANITSPDANTMITTHTPERGQLNVSMINRTGLAALKGVLLYADFKTNGEHKDGVVRLETMRCFNSAGQAMTVLVGEAPVEQVAKPQSWTLHPNYPNPFNPSTSITLEAPVSERVRVVVFSTNGRHIRTLLEATIAQGVHRLQWDGCDDSGAPVPAGLYFCQMRCPESRRQQTIKMMLVK